MPNFKNIQTYIPNNYLKAMDMLINTYWNIDNNYKRHPEDWKYKILDYKMKTNTLIINT